MAYNINNETNRLAHVRNQPIEGQEICEITSCVYIDRITSGPRQGTPIPNPFFDFRGKVLKGDNQGRTFRFCCVFTGNDEQDQRASIHLAGWLQALGIMVEGKDPAADAKLIASKLDTSNIVTVVMRAPRDEETGEVIMNRQGFINYTMVRMMKLTERTIAPQSDQGIVELDSKDCPF
jgi:hypothetical protein